MIGKAIYLILGFAYPAFCTACVLINTRANRSLMALQQWAKYWLQLGLLHVIFEASGIVFPSGAITLVQCSTPVLLWHSQTNYVEELWRRVTEPLVRRYQVHVRHAINEFDRIAGHSANVAFMRAHHIISSTLNEAIRAIDNPPQR